MRVELGSDPLDEREITDVWWSPGDGKHYWPEADEKYMRK